MKNPTDNSRETVDRFLDQLGEPVSPLQVERAMGRVRGRFNDPEAVAIFETPVRQSSMRWVAVAAAVLVAVVGGALQMFLLRPVASGEVARTVNGQVFMPGELIRTVSDARTIELLDGSRIEMSPRAELAIVRVSDGMSVDLNAGTVIVTAAKQRNGHLYVRTKDLVASVVGTVFSVSAETSGSRVSVIEGEVHVKQKQGPTEQTLLPGQQASSSPSLGPLPVQTEISWSTRAPELVALLQQQPGQAPPAPVAVSQIPVSLQGTVKLSGKAEPLAGADVFLCPVPATRVVATNEKYAAAERQFRFTVGRPIDSVAGKDRTYFYALWNGEVCTARPLASVKTDASGRFQFRGLTAGEYTVRSGLAIQNVIVDPQQPAPDIMLAPSSVSGHVRDAEGKALANAAVLATVPATNSFQVITRQTTDERGEYRLQLSPGEYYIVVTSDSVPPTTGILRYYVGWGPAGGAGFTVGQPLPNDATRVALKEGEDVSNIDIVMRPPMPTDAPLLRPASPIK